MIINASTILYFRVKYWNYYCIHHQRLKFVLVFFFPRPMIYEELMGKYFFEAWNLLICLKLSSISTYVYVMRGFRR